MKDIKKLAKKIVKLEKANTQESIGELERIASTLSIEEMLAIDNYIISQKLFD